MAVDKLVDSTQLDADLTSVANAIRTKGGTSASLAFPADFVSAIGAIPTGGGSSVKTGTVTPASRANSVSFDIGMSSITGLLIIPTENPLLSGGKTFVGGYLSTEGYWETFWGTSNNTGSSLLAPANITAGMKATISGTVITVYSYDTNSPSINAGQFEAITYRWYAW